MSYPGSPQSNRSNSRMQELIPKKQQWALINQFKALEYERMKQTEKVMDLEKKKHFKEELDHQLNSKHDKNQIEKEEDKRYYEFITRKAEEQKEREQQQKYNKFMKRKKMEQENQYYLDQMRNSKHMYKEPQSNLDIGIKSEMERKKLEDLYKKDMLDTLDKQLRLKQEEKKRERNKSLEIDQANLKYQFDQFDKRNYHGKSFGQNQDVYQYYKHLDQERRQRQRELQHKIIDEAALKKMEEEDYKRYMKERERISKTNEMKLTLDQQIQNHHRKIQQEKRVNPEEISYSVIGNMFKERTTPYNKHEYSEYLRKQAQQVSWRRKREQYMSDQQYKLNMNQLNRVVSGSYANQKYLDRSIGAIGDGKVNHTQIHDKIEDEDADLIKMRLQNIKARPNRSFGNNDSYIY